MSYYSQAQKYLRGQNVLIPPVFILLLCFIKICTYSHVTIINKRLLFISYIKLHEAVWFWKLFTLYRIQKGVLLCPVYKHLKGMFAYKRNAKGNQLNKTSNPQAAFFFKKKLFRESMKKFVALLTKKKQLRINGKMITPTFFKLYTVYIKKLG